MKILCTFPGRYGDLLWALPTVRAIAEAQHAPVDLQISEKYGAIASLLRQQAYLRRVYADDLWQVVETAPMTPRIAPEIPGYDRVYQLGYEGWPTPDLPRDIARRADVEIDLARPWITASPHAPLHDVVAGFTDEWFELKYGLMTLLADANLAALCAPGSRWAAESPMFQQFVYETDWLEAARFLAGAKVFLGCCSALHVLACAIGIPCVIMEPAEARWNPVFWPYGQHGPQTLLVRGTDDRPTFDARHVRDAVQEKLA